jgi:hypothetical protein
MRSPCAAQIGFLATPTGPAAACDRTAETPLHPRQQRLDPPPQLVRRDPRRNSHRHAPSLKTDADGVVIRKRVPSVRFEFSETALAERTGLLHARSTRAREGARSDRLMPTKTTRKPGASTSGT